MATDDAEYAHRLANLPRQCAQLLPALLMAQAILGCVPDWAVERIAAHLELTVAEVEGMAAAYPQLGRQVTRGWRRPAVS
jgi:NADH:ubiquinone oxidoreductase subunit E